MIYDEYGPVRMVRTADWKYVYRHAHGPDELYDLIKDPGERNNLVGEPVQQGRTGEMKAMMDDWFARYVELGRDGLVEDGAASGMTKRVW